MKKSVLYIIIAVIALAGIICLVLMLYPTVSDRINASRQTRVVTRYLEETAQMDDSAVRAALEAAREYNSRLQHNPNRYFFTDSDEVEYNTLLDAGHGVMGVIVIDKINVQLPIYHGTSEGVLQIGTGHFQGSSLPVGGEGTHTVITGHRGLPSSKLLTSLDRLESGDRFMIHVFGEVLTYEVDQKLEVLPENVDALRIDLNMDYCTLVTCTPYGVNDRRLLVRGHRVENLESAQTVLLPPDAKRLGRPLTILIFSIPILMILFVYVIIRLRKIHLQGRAA
ncbi:MAG: class C sortase [Clostridiales bacterium]|nr:class C sortase [Clostridiales bacterium]